MKKSQYFLLFATLVAFAVLLASAGTPAQQHERQNVLKVGKKGEMTFDKETMVGDVTLKPGRYTFQHRVDGSNHFVHFTGVTEPPPTNAGRGIPTAHPGEIKCQLEMLDKKADRTEVHTTVEGGMTRITKIVVKGENVAHVF